MQPNNPKRPPQGQPRSQFFDVVRPGRTPAGPNARPTLASNRPPVVDNSMKPGALAMPAGLKSAQPAPVPPQPAPKPQSVVLAQPTPITTPSTPEQQDVGKAAVDSQVAPQAEPMFVPDADVSAPFSVQKPEGKRSIWSEVFAVLAIILLIAIIVNILLDADILNLPLPHTNFFDY